MCDLLVLFPALLTKYCISHLGRGWVLLRVFGIEWKDWYEDVKVASFWLMCSPFGYWNAHLFVLLFIDVLCCQWWARGATWSGFWFTHRITAGFPTRIIKPRDNVMCSHVPENEKDKSYTTLHFRILSLKWCRLYRILEPPVYFMYDQY
jgi:hypothetical protein